MCASVVVSIVGVIMLAVAYIIFSEKRLSAIYNFFIFNKYSALCTLGIGGCWFLWNVSHLSLADFGEYKHILFIIFSSVLLMSFIWLRELLSIRGLAVLCLVVSDAILWSVYTEQIFGKLIFVSFIYAIILLSMLIGALPYLWRDAVDYLMKHTCARYITSFMTFAFGLYFVAMPLIVVK